MGGPLGWSPAQASQLQGTPVQLSTKCQGRALVHWMKEGPWSHPAELGPHRTAAVSLRKSFANPLFSSPHSGSMYVLRVPVVIHDPLPPPPQYSAYTLSLGTNINALAPLAEQGPGDATLADCPMWPRGGQFGTSQENGTRLYEAVSHFGVKMLLLP